METIQTAAPQLTGNALFYNQPEPLSLEAHRNLGLRRLERPFAFASKAQAVPLTVSEFGLAAVCFPIIFAGDERTPLAVMGIDGENSLFINADGTVEPGVYLPAYIRRYPFIVANDTSQEKFIVCVDRGGELLTENPDLPLFDAQGQLSDYARNSIQFCENYETERRRTDSFVQLLKDLDLFEKKVATFTPTNPDGSAGEPQKVAEYGGVSEAKLNELPASKLEELRDNGALAQIYAHLLSLVNWDRLLGLGMAKQAAERNAAANG